MPLSHQPGIGQEALDLPEIAPPTPEPYYPVVDITERAQTFKHLFELVSQVRAADGFQKLAASDAGRLALEARYGQKARQIVTGAAQNADSKELAVKELFARAYGVPEMLRAGRDPVQVRAMVKQDYRDFTTHAGFGQTDKQERDKVDRTIQVSSGIINGSRYPRSGRLKPRKAA